MSRRGGAGGGGGAAWLPALLLALLAGACAQVPGVPPGAGAQGAPAAQSPAPAATAGGSGAAETGSAKTGAAETGPAETGPANTAPGGAAPATELPGQNILDLPASQLAAEVEAGTGAVVLVPKRQVKGGAATGGAAATAGPAEEPLVRLAPLMPRPDGEKAAKARKAAAAAAARRRAEAGTDRELARTHRQLGHGLESAGDIAGAVSEYEAALAARWPPAGEPGGKPGETPWGDLARICRRTEPAAAVVRACTSALNPARFSATELAEFLANRGDADARLGRVQVALSDYAGALKIDSSNFQALTGRARVLIRAGRPGAALDDLRLAIATGPRPAEARLLRARALAAAGRPLDALDDYNAVLADRGARPWHRAARRGLAELECSMGRAGDSMADWHLWADSLDGGASYLQEMLRARGFLRGRWEDGIGPKTLGALRAWTKARCP